MWTDRAYELGTISSFDVLLFVDLIWRLLSSQVNLKDSPPNKCASLPLSSLPPCSHYRGIPTPSDTQPLPLQRGKTEKYPRSQPFFSHRAWSSGRPKSRTWRRKGPPVQRAGQQGPCAMLLLPLEKKRDTLERDVTHSCACVTLSGGQIPS